MLAEHHLRMPLGKDMGAVKILLRRQEANPNERDNGGRTPFWA